MATKPRGGGLKALEDGSLRKELFFVASLWGNDFITNKSDNSCFIHFTDPG